MKQIILPMLIATIVGAQAEASKGGGGGGGFCTGTSCETLAQAGLRIKLDHVTTFEVSNDVVDEVSKIVNTLPTHQMRDSRASRINAVIGAGGTLLRSNDESSHTYKKYLKSYLKLMSEYQPQANLSSFRLLGMSDLQKTYLLPGYDRLDTRGKALLLIHEYNIRSGKSLIDTLRFDGMIVDLMKAADLKRVKGFNFWDFTLAAEKVGWNSGELRNNLLFALIAEHGGRVAFSTLCPNERDDAQTTLRCDYDLATALKMRSLRPDFPQYFTNTSVRVAVVELRRAVDTPAFGYATPELRQYAKDMCAQHADLQGQLFQVNLTGEYDSLTTLNCAQ